MLGPGGKGFPSLFFEGTFELLRQRVLRDAHLKMTVGAPDQDRPLDAVGFIGAPGRALGGLATHCGWFTGWTSMTILRRRPFSSLWSILKGLQR
ncbi:MAG: hypothetical protein CM1200mP36_01990 [Gammaproteobacteria bacterium]|nr:MAG: hypothetical protein CM1200mP36_01990 [Gammaproteobacteria bacterium]